MGKETGQLAYCIECDERDICELSPLKAKKCNLQKMLAEDFRPQLTDKQDRIYTFIIEYFLEKKCPPTYRQIAENFKITAQGAYDHIQALKKKGWIRDYKKIIPMVINTSFEKYKL